MQQRYYDPVIGRFYSNDPVGFSASNPMTFNRYAYANNNPYKYVDPDGRVGVAVGRVPLPIPVTQQNHSSTPKVPNQIRGDVGSRGEPRTSRGDNRVHNESSEPTGDTKADSGGSDTSTAIDNGQSSSDQRGNPSKGEPGTWVEHPHGKQDRLYGDDGKPAVDIDYSHDHGQGRPHAHNWDKDVRGTGVPVTVLPKSNK